jgi:hypothetical protein
VEAEPTTKIMWSDAQRAMAGSLLCRLSTDRAHAGHVLALVRRLMPVVFLQTLAEDAMRTVRSPRPRVSAAHHLPASPPACCAPAGLDLRRVAREP